MLAVFSPSCPLILMQCFGIPVQCNFPGGSDGEESACNAGDIRDMFLIPGSGRSPGRGNATHSHQFLPGKFHRQRTLVGYSPWGRAELDTTE